ncbi:MAG: hypothetical protein WCE62_01505 [Polyangiales bacterium]
MIPTLVAAAVVGLAAPVFRGWVWGVPFGLLSIATVLRSFVGSALTVLAIGSLVFFVLGAISMPRPQVAWLAGSIGAVVGLVLLLSSARRSRDVRALSILCQRLREADARTSAANALARVLDRVRRKDPQRHIALVLMATGPLTQAGMWAEARERLLDLEPAALSEPQAVLRNQALATCELQFGDVDAAERAIAAIQRPTEDSVEVWLVAMEALLMAVRGESDAALAHLGEQNTDDQPSLQASHRLVRAHILAGRDEPDAALEELRSLQRQAGRAGLQRVLMPRGPASPLAERLLLEIDQSG